MIKNMKVCGYCQEQFEKTPYDFPLNIVLGTDELEVRLDLKDIIRKSDRQMILSVKDFDKDDVILCIDCYNQITADIIDRLVRGDPIAI